jgi:hypothetical protein
VVAVGIRKVSMPLKEIEALKEYAWKRRLSVSQVVREILDDYRANPSAYRALSDMDGHLSGKITVYVPDEQWYPARDIAYVNGRVPISVIIRKGVHRMMRAEDIPA